MPGSITTSTSQELSTSGMPVAVYGVTIVSDGTPGLLIMRNGINADADVLLTFTGVANSSFDIPWPDIGAVFPNGCYLDIDGHVTSVTVSFERI